MALLNISRPVQAGLWTLATAIPAYLAIQTFFDGGALMGDLYDESVVLGMGHLLIAMGAGLTAWGRYRDAQKDDCRHHLSHLAFGVGFAFFAAYELMVLEISDDPIGAVSQVLGLTILLTFSSYLLWEARPLMKRAGLFLSSTAEHKQSSQENLKDQELKDILLTN